MLEALRVCYPTAHFPIAFGCYVWVFSDALQPEREMHPFMLKKGILLLLPPPACAVYVSKQST